FFSLFRLKINIKIFISPKIEKLSVTESSNRDCALYLVLSLTEDKYQENSSYWNYVLGLRYASNVTSYSTFSYIDTQTKSPMSVFQTPIEKISSSNPE
ncbi:hypothetical protein L9F63_024141, partial [Diploptera punctata]